MISVKKLATVGAAAGPLAVSAMPAFAWTPYDIKVEQSNKGRVENNVITEANTGLNVNSAYVSGDGAAKVKNSNITTGDADATSNVETKLNKNFAMVNTCDCDQTVKVKQENKWGKVENTVGTAANTGINANAAEVDGGGFAMVKNSSINTGNATAGSTVKSVVNKNVAIVN